MGFGAWDLVVIGSMLGVALRWLFRLHVQMYWAACVGAAMMLLQPWATVGFGSLVPTSSLPTIFFGGGVAAALVAALQSLNNH